MGILEKNMRKQSNTILSRSKLDVIEKTRSNIFNWRGQFTPEFVEYMLDTFTCSTDTTFDPFCGSGTVLLESARRDLPSVGFEINPAAYAMARFVTLARLPAQEREELVESLSSRINSMVGSYNNLPLFEIKTHFRDRYHKLIQFAGDLLDQIDNKNEMVFALNSLFHTEKTGKGEITSSIYRSFDIMKRHLLDLPFTTKDLTADLCDARLAHQWLGGDADVILTSPPYINVFNYHQNYRSIVEVIGFDLLKIAKSEIGSNRKNRGNRFRTVVQYALEMEQALASFTHCLKNQGLLILVVGRESRVRGIPFSNSHIILEVAMSLGCYREEMGEERIFTNRFGKRIKEDILVLRKASAYAHAGHARSIAERHLEEATKIAEGDVEGDIADALSEISLIEPSPMFSKKGII